MKASEVKDKACALVKTQIWTARGWSERVRYYRGILATQVEGSSGYMYYSQRVSEFRGLRREAMRAAVRIAEAFGLRRVRA